MRAYLSALATLLITALAWAVWVGAVWLLVD
jgi:hypothetical protein